MAKRRPRHVDVAKHAGVSPAIVSLVLNGKTDDKIRTSAQTVERVRASIRELGSMPNPIAGSLATGQNRIMGVFGLGLVERRVRYVDADTLSGVRPRRAPRGPIAALMLELLDRLGFDDATAAAEDRLLGVLLRDGELHELFDARNGAVLGQREQGWTSALYLWLLRRRRHPARRHAH